MRKLKNLRVKYYETINSEDYRIAKLTKNLLPENTGQPCLYTHVITKD